jgi:hypothetical protein
LMARSPRFSGAWRFAVAAAVAAFAIGISIFLLRDTSAPTMLAATPAALVDARGVALPLAGKLTLMSARGGGHDAELTLAETPTITELRIRTEFESDPPVYRVTLASIGDDGKATLLADVGRLAETEEGFVLVYLAGPRSAGTYRVVLSGDEGTSAADKPSTFLIRIR